MSDNENVFDGLAYMVVGAAVEAKASGLSADEYEWDVYELGDSIRPAPSEDVQEAYDASFTDEGAVQMARTAEREAAKEGDPALAPYIFDALDAALTEAVDTWVAEEREESPYGIDDDDEDEDDY